MFLSAHLSTHSFARHLQQQETAAAAASSSLYLEPFLRTFLLGTGCGILLEGVHVLVKAAPALLDAGPAALSALLPAVGPPLLVADHAAAL